MNWFSKLSATQLGILLAIASAVIMGVHAPAERGVFADGGNVALVMVVTTWARALVLALFCCVTRKALYQSREDTKQAFIGGAFQTLSIFCTFSALYYLPAPLVIIIIYSHALMLLFFMAWRREIKLDVTTVLTTISALGGLSFVLDLWHPQSSANWLGIGLSFMAALATVSRVYVYGHQTKTRNPAVVGAENFLVAAPLASLIVLVSPLQMPASTVGYMWLGLASVVLALGSFCIFYGISLIGAFRNSLFMKIEPVFTCLFSVWFLNEVLKPQQYLGIAVVVGSLVIYQISEQRRVKLRI